MQGTTSNRAAGPTISMTTCVQVPLRLIAFICQAVPRNNRPILPYVACYDQRLRILARSQQIPRISQNTLITGFCYFDDRGGNSQCVSAYRGERATTWSVIGSGTGNHYHRRLLLSGTVLRRGDKCRAPCTDQAENGTVTLR